MCFSKASETGVKGVRPCFLVESKKNMSQSSGTLTWFIEWKNLLSAQYFSCSWEGVLMKMGAFHEDGLLIKRIGLDPSRKQRCSLVSILWRYIVAYGSAFVEDEAIIVLIKSQNKIHWTNRDFASKKKQNKRTTYDVRNLTEGVLREVFRRLVFAIGEIDGN